MKKDSGFEKEKSAKELAWELFKRSGNINYYRLYSDLKEREEK